MRRKCTHQITQIYIRFNHTPSSMCASWRRLKVITLDTRSGRVDARVACSPRFARRREVKFNTQRLGPGCVSVRWFCIKLPHGFTITELHTFAVNLHKPTTHYACCSSFHMRQFVADNQDDCARILTILDSHSVNRAQYAFDYNKTIRIVNGVFVWARTRGCPDKSALGVIATRNVY